MEGRFVRDGAILLHGGTSRVVAKFVVQVWSALNGQWMDASAVDTLSEALRLAGDEQPSERWPRSRVVLRTIAILESDLTLS